MPSQDLRPSCGFGSMELLFWGWHVTSGRERPDRRYDCPAYPVEEVVELARRLFIQLTKKAEKEAAGYLGDDTISIRMQVREILLDLTSDEWKFCQVKNGSWVDVYRVEVFEDAPAAWIKVKIESLNGYQGVLIISFHEYDDD